MYNQTGEFPNAPFISDTVLDLCGLFFKLILNPTLGVAGVCSNVINMAVFFKMGLRDGVAQNFFILSISDGIFSAAALANSVAYILVQVVRGEAGGIELEMQRFYWASFFAVPFPQNVSLITTVVISVVRCCCVAMPLRVKFLLTAPRQLAAILIPSAAAILFLLYVFAPMRTVYLKNPQTNKQSVVIVGYRWAMYTLYSGITFYTSFISVIVCVVILSVNINRSSNFRRSASGPSSSNQNGRKETRVVKTVVLVAVVFIVCYTPHLLYSIVKAFLAEFTSQAINMHDTIMKTPNKRRQKKAKRIAKTTMQTSDSTVLQHHREIRVQLFNRIYELDRSMRCVASIEL
ncbi:hypothetical protein EGW08_004982 [Elysia chlorotica]|uniref:G-protein coupled receptors family 1 profile domain-containing protein n=1 Tax=Elysia chlorotica TaxID=188477 RepID=A0A433U0A1_ELYCH|nr:hypothetical protein EGW08_004982 [Elysia chlorotica]